MLLFIDSANPAEIQEIWEYGIIDGVTTNPSLAAKVKGNYSYKEIVAKILELVDGPVSLETISTDFDGIVREGRALAKLSQNVVVKIPCIAEGFKAAKFLSSEEIKVNMTLCFSVSQALLAHKVGATYISPFIGRLDDIEPHSGDALVRDIRKVYDNYNSQTKILDASIRDIEHVEESAIMGADVATVPHKILMELHEHPQTYKGLEKFLHDWEEAGLELPL